MELFGLLLNLVLTDPVPLDPNTLDPLAHHPRIMLKHTWKFNSPTYYPALPRGQADPR